MSAIYDRDAIGRVSLIIINFVSNTFMKFVFVQFKYHGYISVAVPDICGVITIRLYRDIDLQTNGGARTRK